MAVFNPLDYDHLLDSKWENGYGIKYFLYGIILKEDDWYWVMRKCCASLADDELLSCVGNIEDYGYTRIPEVPEPLESPHLDDENEWRQPSGGVAEYFLEANDLREECYRIMKANYAESDRVWEKFVEAWHDANEVEVEENMSVDKERIQEKLAWITQALGEIANHVNELRYSIDEAFTEDAATESPYERFERKLEEARGASEYIWTGDNLMRSMEIIRKYIPTTDEVLTGWSGQLLYSVSVEDIVDGGVCDEDIAALGEMDWLVNNGKLARYMEKACP